MEKKKKNSDFVTVRRSQNKRKMPKKNSNAIPFLIFINLEIILKTFYNNIIMKELIVNKKYDNKKLSKLLLETYPGLKYGTFVKALKRKDILINDKRISKDCIVHEKDISITMNFLTAFQNYVFMYIT